MGIAGQPCWGTLVFQREKLIFCNEMGTTKRGRKAATPSKFVTTTGAESEQITPEFLLQTLLCHRTQILFSRSFCATEHGFLFTKPFCDTEQRFLFSKPFCATEHRFFFSHSSWRIPWDLLQPQEVAAVSRSPHPTLDVVTPPELSPKCWQHLPGLW